MVWNQLLPWLALRLKNKSRHRVSSRIRACSLTLNLRFALTVIATDRLWIVFYDDEDIIGMEKNKYRIWTDVLNESDADFHFKTTGKANFRRLMNCIYPLLRIQYFLARGGIEPRGRCFMHHHTNRAFPNSSPNRTKIISTNLQPSPPELSVSQLPSDISHAGLHRWSHLWPDSHESPRIAVAVFGSVWYPSAQHTEKNAVCFALHAAVIKSGQQARCSALCVCTG